MVDDVLREARQRMQAAVEAVTRELRGLRTGKANIAILDDITVDYYGTQTPLNQVASLSAPESNLLLIQPYDKSVVDDIEKAILQSDLGLNPNNDGNVIRVPIPELTEERRQELAKVVGRISEEGKMSVRHARREANDALKTMSKEGEISEDDEHRGHQRAQELTDEHCREIDEFAERKREEILTI